MLLKNLKIGNLSIPVPIIQGGMESVFLCPVWPPLLQMREELE